MRDGTEITKKWSGALFVAFLAMTGLVPPAGARLDAVETTASGTTKAVKSGHVRFGDLYVAGMAALLPGGGTLEAPGGKPRVSGKTLRSDLLIPSGSLVSTGADETARIRLGERSLLRVRPNSALRIFSLRLELVRGELCVQQGKTILPLRIQAASSTIDLERDSAADFFLSEDGRMIVTVQAGTAKVAGESDAVVAGQRVEVRSGTVVTDPPVARLADWFAYAEKTGVQEYTPRLGLDIGDGADDAPSALTPGGQEPTGGEPVRPDDTSGELVPGSPQTPSDVLQDHFLEDSGR
ncbi:MAG TPA: hypothetical protein PLU72_00220 [Candidatus Ozemobacteraceae bacterium]|nr:hypothetical protein [Candidatus Ozemobacteraceae bacterium]